jgi:uncharacterized protein YndB with AHSA1/START domain
MKSSKAAAFKIIREFNAPKEDVFNAFATEEALNEWWGPAETNNSAISLDFRSGGIFRFKMERDGQVNYARFLFKKIEPHDLLEFFNSFTDEQGNVISAPFDISLPKSIFYSLSFTGRGDVTTLTLTATPADASPSEIEGFQAISEGMQEGFTGTFDKLASYLNKN